GSSCRIWPAGSAGGYPPRADRGGRPDPGRTPMRPAVPGSGQVARRIDRGRALADLEMELRLIDAAGLPHGPDNLTRLDRLILGHVDLPEMGIGGDEVVGVPNQHEIAVAAQLVAGIGDGAARCRPDRRAARGGDVDPLIGAAGERG